jgi:hypothetical protein
MTTIAFDPAAFRVLYPQFANAGTYPDVMLNDWWATATSIVSADDYGCLVLTGTKRVQALNLLTAHIGTLFQRIQAGGHARHAAIGHNRQNGRDAHTAAHQDAIPMVVVTDRLRRPGAHVASGGGRGGLFRRVGYPERAAFRKAGGSFECRPSRGSPAPMLTGYGCSWPA